MEDIPELAIPKLSNALHDADQALASIAGTFLEIARTAPDATVIDTATQNWGRAGRAADRARRASHSADIDTLTTALNEAITALDNAITALQTLGTDTDTDTADATRALETLRAVATPHHRHNPADAG